MKGVNFEAPIEEEKAWTIYAPNKEECDFSNCKGVPDHIIVQVSADCDMPHEIRVNVACTTHKEMIEEEVI